MKKSVLIVDDKPEVAKVVSIYISAECDVQYFENPVKAIAWLLQGNVPDLIISDVNMPEMEGSEFLVYLKSSELFKSIPVLILSSLDSSSDRVALLEQGAEDFMVKPFNPQELKIKVKKLLR